ncbi:hypothetical protein BH787_gp30 [Gordonia phage GMA4]|uniref:hypothetical protein n=1 Tax=Gordonia phage GMA4 TaxID=1647471 RepID=UPI0006BCB107|nr:hypothetical protein BH787_gp30 [Gordonia phage GMA4]AKJ72318.1 hypothetical protein GMA4_43 [Gordonia phage GMA4]
MRPSELRNEATRDLSGMSRDTLEFHCRQIAKGAIDWIDMVQKQEAAQREELRRHITISTFLLGDLQKARGQGRKTIRIDDLLAEAERKYAEFIDRYPEAAADCPCPSCVHEAGRRV